ncbi:Phosphate regulon transcriptional regulatory protein PhoB [compost metagenome]
MLGYPVAVRSQPGRGSVFSIRVPLTQRVINEAPVTSSVRSLVGDPLPGRRLLVLDNELSILHSMAALLEQWGCVVVTAVDQEDAVRVLNGQAPDLILADFHLDHDVLGCAVVAYLRQYFGSPLPAVMITADRSDQCRRELQRMGMPLLNKPVKPGKLRAVVSQMLRESPPG